MKTLNFERACIFFYSIWNIIHFCWNFTVLRDAARLIFTVARCAKDKRSQIEWRMKTLGKTSCSTKTRRYSKAVCSTQRDRWKSRRTGRVARSLARLFKNRNKIRRMCSLRGDSYERPRWEKNEPRQPGRNDFVREDRTCRQVENIFFLFY